MRSVSSSPHCLPSLVGVGTVAGGREKENSEPALLSHDVDTTIASADLAFARLDNDVPVLSVSWSSPVSRQTHD
jgi:hypothetical protein